MLSIAKSSKPVALMQKNLTKEEKEARLEAESKVKTASDLVYEVPADIVKAEQEVYKFLVEELKELDILCNLDIELLKLTANTVVNIREAKKNIRKYGQIIERANGDLVKNPAITVLKDFESIFNRCCRELCLSPQSRMALSRMLAEASANSEDELLKILSE